MRVLSLDKWLSALADPGNRLEFNQRFYGEAVRTDGWSCRDRWVDWHLIYLALHGRSEGRTADGTDISIEPGQALWIPPMVGHDFQWTRVFRYAEIWFRSGPAGDLSPMQGPMVVSGAGGLRPMFGRLADELSVRRPLSEPCLRSLLAVLAVELFRLNADDARARAGLTAHQRDKLARHVQAHLADGLTAFDLSREVGMSPGYFARQFRATYGTSPRKWLARERIRAASRLLAGSEMRIFEIAEALGYADVPQFSRQFKTETGVSPQDFRQTAGFRPEVDWATGPDAGVTRLNPVRRRK